MVEAGANEIPEDTLLEAFDLAHAEIKKLCELQEELRARAGKPIGSTPSSPTSSRLPRRVHLRPHSCRGPPRGRSRDRHDRRRSLPADLDRLDRRGHRPRDAGPRQPRGDPRAPAPRGRLAPGPRAVRGRARALTDHEQDSKQPGRPSACSSSGSSRPPTCRSRSGRPRSTARRRRSRTFSRGPHVKKAAEAIYKDRDPPQDRHREAPPGRAGHRRDPADRLRVGVSARTHGSALFTRGQTRIVTLLTLAPPRRGSGSTTSPSRSSAATCTTTTSRPTRSGRRASCAAPSAATSATGRSHRRARA